VGRHLEYLQALIGDRRPQPGIFDLIGMRLTSVEHGAAVVELEVGPRHHNPMGTLHGGIMCDVADAAMGIAYRTTVGDEDGFTTVELKINFIRPMVSGRIRATGKLVKGGRRLGLVECDVTDDQGRLIAKALSTCMTLPGEAGTQALPR
jgi:uncharacterized protein (TIGR00369 family)